VHKITSGHTFYYEIRNLSIFYKNYKFALFFAFVVAIELFFRDDCHVVITTERFGTRRGRSS